MNIAIKQGTGIFDFPMYMKIVLIPLHSIKYAMVLCLENVHTFMKSNLLIENAKHHVTLQRVVIFLQQPHQRSLLM